MTANPEIAVKVNEEEKYMEMLKSADCITAEGIGIVKGAKILGTPITERVAGYTLMLELLKGADCNNKHLAGHHNGYFGLTDETIMNEALNAKPGFLFVGLGFHRQEKWIQRYLKHATKG